MNKRNWKIEILRFIAALLIINGHLGEIGLEGPRPFSIGWFYVELFFIITGFFTVRHFDDKRKGTVENSAAKPAVSSVGNACLDAVKTSVLYTVKKFARFLPFTTIPIIITYICKNIQGCTAAISWVHGFEGMPFELLYVSAANPEGSKMYTIWFISAMFIVFPIFCLMLHLRSKILVGMISVYFTAFYYLHQYDFGSHVFPNQLFRAFAGLCLGVLVYYLADWLNKQELRTCIRVLLTAAEVICVLLPFAACWKNLLLLRMVLICFIISASVILSGQSLIGEHLPEVLNNIAAYFGKLSLAMYVWHLAVCFVLQTFASSLSLTQRTVCLWVITFAAAILNTVIVDAVKVHRTKQLNK